jgi:hypothetical protein
MYTTLAARRLGVFFLRLLPVDYGGTRVHNSTTHPGATDNPGLLRYIIIHHHSVIVSLVPERKEMTSELLSGVRGLCGGDCPECVRDTRGRRIGDVGQMAGGTMQALNIYEQ